MLGLLQVAVSLTRGDRALPSQFPDCLGQVESPEQVASSVEPLGLLGIARAAHMSHIYNLLCHTSRTNLTSIGTSRRGQTRSYRLRTRSHYPTLRSPALRGKQLPFAVASCLAHCPNEA